jgi:toxin ParE1/3/4
MPSSRRGALPPCTGSRAGIEAILAHSQEHFGEPGRLRYEALLVQALHDVAEDPERGAAIPGRNSPKAPGRTTCISVETVSTSQVGRVRRPRHFLLYRTKSGGIVELGRVLHDSMDLDRHLPDDYRSQTAEDNEEVE